MARIRSVHPGLFTDEAFVSISDGAQIFYIGLLTEADDQGVFEWKPITLKMRIRPASLSPVDGLLAELEGAERIVRYEVGGRHYGAIRNFRKFQRPKAPNALHPITADIRIYVGLSPPISEIASDEPISITQKGEISPQMEDGGDKMEDGKKERKQRARREKPPDRPSNGDAEAYPWPMVDIEGRTVPAEVPMEWVGETYRSHPLVDGYAAMETFASYWTEGKGAGTTRTERGWHQCWQGWIGREKAGRSIEWINRYGYSRHLNGSLVDQRTA